LIAAVDRASLERELRERVDGEIRFDAGTLAAYSTDASNFRQVPIAVVIPRTVEAAVAAVSVCAAHRAPLLSRGGGTSLAGQCTNAAVVIDWTKHCHRVVSVDPERRRCVVEPGIVLDELNRRLAPTGLRYGPEPATHPNCTLGGMIGNNSCGATAQRTGKVVDNTPRLEVLLHDGTRFWCERTGDEQNAAILAQGGRRSEIYRALRELADACQDEIRERFPDIPRRVSGYNLDSLLPEHGFDIAGLLIGSESTLVTVLHAELELVPVIPERTLVVIGYPTVAEAADAVPALTPYDPIALEGMDRRLVRDQELKNEHSEAIEQLPDGNGWLLVQFGGDTAQEAGERARTMRIPSARRSSGGLGRPASVPRRMSPGAGTPGRAGRTRRSRPSGWEATCAISTPYTRITATWMTARRRSTATSATAASTPGSPSTCTPTRAWPNTGASCTRRLISSPGTAVRCRASTATARAAGSCCRGCSETAWSRPSAASRRSSTPAT
jgi:FAD/FMN-containing dehydrogenase